MEYSLENSKPPIENSTINFNNNNINAINNCNLQNEEKTNSKKDKKDFLDFKNAFNKLKKFLQNENLMFLCKSCNNYLLSNYSLEDVLVLHDKKLNFIFSLESIHEEAEKELNKEADNDLFLKQISNFFLTERNILISEKTDFTQSESSHINFIFHNLICKKCDIAIGKYVKGVPLNLIKFDKKIFLYEDKIATIRKYKNLLPEKVNFEDFIAKDSIFQNILKGTNKEMENSKNDMFNFAYSCSEPRIIRMFRPFTSNRNNLTD